MKTEEADRLVVMEKAIGEPIVWQQVRPSRHQRYRFKVRVIASTFRGHLYLVGVATETGSWGYNFLGPGNIVLRRISNPLPGHWDPCSKQEASPHHKHSWTEEHEDRCTYVPDDIRWDNFNHALVDFLLECNIKPLHPTPELHFQTRMV